MLVLKTLHIKNLNKKYYRVVAIYTYNYYILIKKNLVVDENKI